LVREKCDCSSPYDDTYPLSKPYLTNDGLTYKIAMISDLDTNSKSHKKDNTWLSYLKTGNLTLSNPSFVRYGLERGYVSS
jgi:hypothetical protein